MTDKTSLLIGVQPTSATQYHYKQGIVVSKNGNFMVVAGYSTTELFERDSGGVYRKKTLHSGVTNIGQSAGYFTMDISYDSRTLLISARNTLVYFVDLYNPTATPRSLNVGYPSAIRCTNTTREAMIVYNDASYKAARLYNLDTLEPVASWMNKGAAGSGGASYHDFAFSPNDDVMYYTWNAGNSAAVYRKTIRSEQNLNVTEYAGRLMISPNGKYVVVSQKHFFYDDGTQAVRLPDPAVMPSGYRGCFTKDSKYFLSGAMNAYKIQNNVFVPLPATPAASSAMFTDCTEDHVFVAGNSIGNAVGKNLGAFDLKTKIFINKLNSENVISVVNKNVKGCFGIAEQVATKGQQCKVNLFKKQNQAFGQSV